MHAAAVSGIKTFGLFGPSFPHLYAPYGPQAAYITTPQSYDELINYEGYHPKTAPCLMEGLGVADVKNALKDFLAQ